MKCHASFPLLQQVTRQKNQTLLFISRGGAWCSFLSTFQSPWSLVGYRTFSKDIGADRK
jgi:hypothetical protein